MLRRRRELIECYDEALADKPVTVRSHYGPDFSSSGHLYLMNLNGKGRKERDDFIIRLAEKEIAANVHYKPLPLHTGYRKLGFRPEDYPHAVALFENEVTLPLNTCLTDAMVEYLLENVGALL